MQASRIFERNSDVRLNYICKSRETCGIGGTEHFQDYQVLFLCISLLLCHELRHSCALLLFIWPDRHCKILYAVLALKRYFQSIQSMLLEIEWLCCPCGRSAPVEKAFYSLFLICGKIEVFET